MKNKTILICLERIDIGGIETYVLNQARVFKKKGHKVIVMCEDGIYRKTLEQNGIVWVNFKFELKNYFDYEKVKKIIDIINKYNVNEVHIQTLTCVSAAFPACVICNIPYIMYLHMGVSVIEDTFSWFDNQSIILKLNMKDVLKNAYKIIIINNLLKDFVRKKYSIEDEDKFIYLRNSIDFEEYKCNNIVSEIKNVLIVSRLDEVKLQSIKNGVLLFNELNKLYDGNLNLYIAGDGNNRKEIEDFVKQEETQNVKFLGAITDVKSEIEKCDIVIGVARCILEAVAMKRMAVISHYGGMKTFVDENNIKTEINENFCGKALDSTNIEKLAQKIKSLKQDEINSIVDYNYRFIKSKLDINDNVYIANTDVFKYDTDFNLTEIIMNDGKAISNILNEKCEKMENDWKEHLKYKEWMENKEKEHLRTIEQLQKENNFLNRLIIIRLLKKMKIIMGK